MPTMTQIFCESVTSRFRQYYEGQENKDFFLFETSLSINIRCVSIKPETKESSAAESDRKFVSVGLIDQNIRSDDGLIQVLMNPPAEEEVNEYIPAILVDCNIYWRVMKVHSLPSSKTFFAFVFWISDSKWPLFSIIKLFFLFIASSPWETMWNLS